MRAQSAQAAAAPAKKINREHNMYVSLFIPWSGQSALGDRVIQVRQGLHRVGTLCRCDGFGWKGEGWARRSIII